MTYRRGAPAIACVLAVLHGCSPRTSPPLLRQTVTPANAQLPSWLRGVWTREWIERAASRTSSLDVHYLQTASAFADVRIPRNRLSLSHATSFADLTNAQLHLLALQRGFTGTTTIAGDLATWHHEIDFQPPDPSPDIGRIERIDDAHMLEHALDSSYIESWRSLDDGAGKFLVLRLERAGRLERALLIAGDHFLYVRNREHDLPAAASLDSLILSTKATRALVIAYLDCEFSAGRVRGGSVPWEIQHSTLPWREGRHLEAVDSFTVSRGAVKPRTGGTPAD
jgi:hypothetical protein